MWETIAIIATLGGLEFTLWLLDRRKAKRDHEMQQRQLEILDGTLTELAIQNSEEVTDAKQGKAGDKVEHAGMGGKNGDRTQEHLVCD